MEVIQIIENYTCPYCEVLFVVSSETHSELPVGFQVGPIDRYNEHREEVDETAVRLDFYKCPNCNKYCLELMGFGSEVKDIDIRVKPFGKSRKFPDYIPIAIRNDYEEACAIKDLSPKSSATLARRCLQGMIRDFWEIKENTLYTEIQKLKDKIPATQWNVIDSIRQIGNIGAHMEQDINKIINIDPMEVERLIKLIEFLMEHWYINKHETELLYQDIIETNDKKQKERKS